MFIFHKVVCRQFLDEIGKSVMTLFVVPNFVKISRAKKMQKLLKLVDF